MLLLKLIVFFVGIIMIIVSAGFIPDVSDYTNPAKKIEDLKARNKLSRTLFLSGLALLIASIFIR